MTAAIAATIKPYSTAVAPSSSLKSFTRFLIIAFLLGRWSGPVGSARMIRPTVIGRVVQVTKNRTAHPVASAVGKRSLTRPQINFAVVIGCCEWDGVGLPAHRW